MTRSATGRETRWARRLSGRRALARVAKRSRSWLERGLLLAGVAGLGLYALAWGDARWVQAVEGHRLAAAVQAARQQVAGLVAGTGPAETPAPEPGDLLGRIDIAGADVSSVILEGTDDGVLRHAVGHITGTALPGDAGNVVLAGHRDSFFAGLRNVAPGDLITLTTPATTQVYRIEQTRVVVADDVALLAPTEGATLTLITCYPFHWVGPAPRRFVVRARRLDDEDDGRDAEAVSLVASRAGAAGSGRRGSGGTPLGGFPRRARQASQLPAAL